MRRRQLLGGLGAAGLGLAAPALAGSGRGTGSAETEHLLGGAFGSYWRVVLAAGHDTAPIREDIAAVVAAYDAALSPYRDDSEISRFNATDSADWLPVSDLFAEVMGAALDAARRTGGAFDPTVGPIVGRFGFGPITGARGSLDSVAAGDGAAKKAGPCTLDFCGIAKGRALDEIAARLTARGVGGCLIELGGEVMVTGWHPAQRRWRVAVEAPGRGTPLQALELTNKAVATSGAWPQSYQVADKRYGHIVDPRTEMPVTGDLGSVSVIADTAMEADALATALYARGTDGALDLAETLGLDTLLLVADGPDWRVLTTGRADAWRLG